MVHYVNAFGRHYAHTHRPYAVLYMLSVDNLASFAACYHRKNQSLLDGAAVFY